MDNKFTVIKSTETDCDEETKRVYRTGLLNEAWERQYYNALEKSCTGRVGQIKDLPQDELAKIGFAGIKYICTMRDVTRENKRLSIDEGRTLAEEQIKFQMIDSIFTILGCLTLRNFVNTFPIEKDYSGGKWECKDYFSTMEVLSNMDWDKPIGREKFFDFLWDYENGDLRNVCVDYMCAMSAIYRSQTGKGIAEQFCGDHGIGAYTVDNETGIMKNNQTGDIVKAKRASHLHLVE